MINKIDFSILPKTIDKDDYCNKYVELALKTDFSDSYEILESIYYLGRWYATRKSLKLYFGLADSSLKVKLDVLKNFGLVEYHKTDTNKSYVKLTNNGASLINKRIVKWNSNNKKDISSLIRKSELIYTVASNKIMCNPDFFKKNIDRDKIIQDTLSKHYITNNIKISTLEQSHIYIFNCNNKFIGFAIDYSNMEEYIRDCIKIYEFLSSYEIANDINVNIVVVTDNINNTLITLGDVSEGDFKKSFRAKLLKYFISKNINMDFDAFLDKIVNSTKLLEY